MGEKEFRIPDYYLSPGERLVISYIESIHGIWGVDISYEHQTPNGDWAISQDVGAFLPNGILPLVRGLIKKGLQNCYEGIAGAADDFEEDQVTEVKHG